MGRPIRVAMGAVVAGVIVLATTASAADTPGTVAFVKRATESTQPRTTVVPASQTDTVTPSAAELEDLATLAESMGMTVDEAVASYGWRSAFAKVADDLRHEYPASFAEAAARDGGARISFTGDAPADVAARIAAARLPVPVRIRDRMGWNETEIVEAAQRVHYAVAEQNVYIATDPGAETGEIRVTAGPKDGTSVDELRARIREAATSDGPLRDALDLVPSTVTVVIEVVPAELAPRDFLD
jgi:hypothetical protein